MDRRKRSSPPNKGSTPEQRRRNLEQIHSAPRRFPHLSPPEAREREREALRGVQEVVEASASDILSSAPDQQSHESFSIQETPNEYLTFNPQHHRPGLGEEEMSKPVLFYGKPSQLEDVLTYAQVKNLVDGNADDRSKCGLLASLFRGQALHWLTNQLSKAPKILSDYDELVESLRTEFGLNDDAKKAQASQRISTISQKGPVQLYAIEFRQLVATLNLDDQTARAYFTRGLKLHVREALVASGGAKTLDSLVSKATRIDTELYNARKPRSGGGSGQQRSRGGIKCNNCGKFGHKAAECRIKKETF